MGMSTHVVGFKPPDEKWRKMKAAWDSCTAAGVDVPKEIGEFFNWSAPDERGVIVKLEEWKDGKKVLHECLREWSEDTHTREGYEIDVTKLPKDVTVLRFYNSW